MILYVTSYNNVLCEASRYSTIQIHRLVSNLPTVCQVKVSFTSLDSENIQESNVPFEIVKLRIPSSDSFTYNLTGLTGVFGFFPRPANRSYCAINFHYIRTDSQLEKQISVTNHSHVLYSLFILNSVIRAQLGVIPFGQQERNTYLPYNILLTNKMHNSYNDGFFFHIDMRLSFLKKPPFPERGFKPTELLHRFAIISYSPEAKHFLFCPMSVLESMLKFRENCKYIVDFYGYLRSSDLKEWKQKLKTHFYVQPITCSQYWYLRWPSSNWPEIDSLNIFRSSNVNEVLAYTLVRKSNESGVKSFKDQHFLCAGTIHVENIHVKWSGEQANEKDTTISSDSIKLFTCYEKPRVSFYMYVSPFDTDTTVWLLFLIHAGAVWLVFEVFVHIQQLHSSYSPLLFILGTVIDEAYVAPKKLRRLATFKVLVLPWILGSMLLSSCYQSILVATLNSPLASESMKSVNQTFCPQSDEFLHSFGHLTKGNYGRFTDAFWLDMFWKLMPLYILGSTRHSNDTWNQHTVLELQQKYLKLPEAKNCFAILLLPTLKLEEIWSFGLKWGTWPLFYYNLRFKEYDEKTEPRSLKAMLNRKFKYTYQLLSPLSRHFCLLDDIGAEKSVSSNTFFCCGHILLQGKRIRILGSLLLSWKLQETKKSLWSVQTRVWLMKLIT